MNVEKMIKPFGPNEPYKEVEKCPKKVKKVRLSKHPEETLKQSEDTTLRDIDLNIVCDNDILAYCAKKHH